VHCNGWSCSSIEQWRKHTNSFVHAVRDDDGERCAIRAASGMCGRSTDEGERTLE
jgi:hypothetical protein